MIGSQGENQSKMGKNAFSVADIVIVIVIVIVIIIIRIVMIVTVYSCSHACTYG
jgi:flagellar basal body-associated protein FliL